MAVLWQPLLNRFGIRIHFAHRTFKWTIDERKAEDMRIAAVYCVIIGFAAYGAEKKYLFDYEKPTSEPHRVTANNINPYLIDAINVVMGKRSKPICDVPEMSFGSKPVDDGNLIFTDNEKLAFLSKEPRAEKYFRPLLSAKEYLHNENRWCLWLKDADPADLHNMPLVMDRIKKVRTFRLASKKEPTKEAATYPALFAELRQPDSDFIIIPLHTSETRKYIPFGYFGSKHIVHNSCSGFQAKVTLHI